jgi:hypothetical protein
MMRSDDSEEVYLKVNGFTFLKHDNQTGVTTYFRTNEDGSTTVYHRQDVEPILEANTALFNESGGRRHDDWQLVARVPDIISDNIGLSKAIGQKDRKFIGKILNDSEYRKFRTFDSKVGK